MLRLMTRSLLKKKKNIFKALEICMWDDQELILYNIFI